jgi:hypothetical protein
MYERLSGLQESSAVLEVDVKILKKVMKVRLRGPDIQLIPVGMGGVKDGFDM